MAAQITKFRVATASAHLCPTLGNGRRNREAALREYHSLGRLLFYARTIKLFEKMNAVNQLNASTISVLKRQSKHNILRSESLLRVIRETPQARESIRLRQRLVGSKSWRFAAEAPGFCWDRALSNLDRSAHLSTQSRLDPGSSPG